MAGTVEARQSSVKNGAWWTLACCMSIMLVAGTLYGFGAWSPAMKETYGFKQDVIDGMAVASHLGNYIVLDSGWLTTRFGTVFGMTLGCIYASLGYLFLWASIDIWPGQVPTGLILAACVLYGHGCGTIDNAVMTEALSDFRDYKGNANGCIKAYYGLATATVAMIYEAVFKPKKSTFLLFLGLYSAACAFTFVPVVARTKGLVDESARRTAKKFRLLAVGILTFALYFFFVQMFKAKISTKWWRVILATVIVGMMGLFSLPMQQKRKHRNDEDGIVKVPVAFHPPRDVTGFQMLTHLDFWLFVFICVIGQGCGLMFLSNASQILPALAGHDMDDSTTAFVAGISVFNSLSRLAFGMASEKLRGKVPRSIFLVFAMVFLTLGYVLIWLGEYAFVWPAAMLVGFGYGGLWGVQPPMISELFGPSDFSFKYACSAMAAAVGSVVFNELLAGPVFDANAEGRPEFPKCFVSSCFTTSFRTAAMAGVPAVLVSVWVVQRTRWIYQGKGIDEDDSSSEVSDSEDRSGSN